MSSTICRSRSVSLFPSMVRMDVPPRRGARAAGIRLASTLPQARMPGKAVTGPSRVKDQTPTLIWGQLPVGTCSPIGPRLSGRENRGKWQPARVSIQVVRVETLSVIASDC